MGQFIDLRGQEFGRLTVLRPADMPPKTQGHFWVCACSCEPGKETIAATAKLRAGRKTSCGCKQNRMDLSGKRVGTWTVLRQSKARGKNRALHWQIKCDCGFERTAPTADLNAGKIVCRHGKAKRGANLKGRRFGRLKVVELAGRRRGNRVWLCQCACGRNCRVSTGKLHSRRKGCRRCALSSHFKSLNRSRSRRFRDMDSVTRSGSAWLAPRRFCTALDISQSTAREWRRRCTWLGRGVRTLPIKDASGCETSFFSAGDMALILEARASRGATRQRRWNPGRNMPEAAVASLPLKKRRGRPEGSIDPEVADRKQKLLADWKRRRFGENKAAYARAYDFHRPDVSKWIKETEKAS